MRARYLCYVCGTICLSQSILKAKSLWDATFIYQKLSLLVIYIYTVCALHNAYVPLKIRDVKY